MSTDSRSLRRSGPVVAKERFYALVLGACAFLTLLVTVGIVLSLLVPALEFFTQVSPVAFLTGTEWSPLVGDPVFGVLPLLTGTLIVTVVSAMIALPIGLAVAIYLSEYARPRVRSYLKPTLEILAAVPTVVYGYFALVYVTPILDVPLPVAIPIVPAGIEGVPAFTFEVPSLGTFNALSASVIVGIMIIPMVSSISEDAISSVPDSLREAAYGLGSTKFDVSTKVVVPAATSGIVSSYVLAISRAIGETMIVTIAAGLSPHMPYVPDVLRNLTEATQTMTAAMVQIVGSEQTGGAGVPLYESMFAIGITLFVVTLVMNLVAELVRRHFREVYD
ncbi:MAG: phosphate ABC transporter permease subunit PstC [Halococcoides sp.]